MELTSPALAGRFFTCRAIGEAQGWGGGSLRSRRCSSSEKPRRPGSPPGEVGVVWWLTQPKGCFHLQGGLVLPVPSQRCLAKSASSQWVLSGRQGRREGGEAARSASTLVLPMSIQGRFPLRLIGFISVLFKGHVIHTYIPIYDS